MRSCDFPRRMRILGFLLARLKKELKWFSTEITSPLLDYIPSVLDKQEPRLKRGPRALGI